MSRLVPTALALILATSAASAQSTGGSRGVAAAGGALGLTAGAMIGNVGTILPCTQTTLGARCVAGGTIVGGAIGLAAGLAVGASDTEMVIDRATSGLIGFGAGIVITLVGRPFFQRVGLEDALALGMVGGAIGTQPRGALLGAGVGAGLGVALWLAVPGFEAPDAIGASLAGVMVGVLAGWVADGVDTRSAGAAAVPLLSLRLSL